MKKRVVLLVEDNPGDQRLTLEAWKEAATQAELVVASESGEALSRLRGADRPQHEQRPSLVLLDLNLPGKSGREILREIKADPELRRVPVIVLTTSTADTDVLQSYEAYANCYIVKPAGWDGLIGILREIDRFWLKTVELPQ